jgi:hypothetical protein
VALKEQAAGPADPASGQPARAAGATCTASVTVRALNADNGEILAAAEANELSHDQSPLACGREATQKATRRLAADLQQRLLATWSRQLDAGTRLTVRVAGVDSLGTLNALLARLKDSVRGVKDVQQRRFQGGSADLDVSVTGSSQAFASELEELTIKGRKVEVVGLSANTVELRLAK